MNINFIKYHPDARLPARSTKSAAGLDLYALEDTEIPPGSGLVRTGIGILLPYGYEATVRPRSSLSKRHIHVALGTIDADYRGEIKVCVHSPYTMFIQGDHRIAQLVITKVEMFKPVWTDQIQNNQTERGAGGFGSTGV